MNEIDKIIWLILKKKEKDISIKKIKKLIKERKDDEEIENRFNEILNNINTLNKLKKIPFIKQRTPEWHELRKDKLTASVLEEAVNNNITLIKKKAGLIIDNTNYNNIPALKWGTMYEPMALKCYSIINNDIEINEFGLIADEEDKKLAASPDGINSLGIMIEIKCPYSRKIIDGVIPSKYNLQMQGQLKVCKLTECHYVECEFIEYENIEKYKEDNDKELNGIIAEYKRNNGEYYYIYSEILNDKNDVIKDILEKVKNNEEENTIFMKYNYWKLNLINIQNVKFDKKKWNEYIEPRIEEFWKKVEEYKKMPKKNLFIDDD